MVPIFSLWILLAAPPILTKSIGHNPDVSDSFKSASRSASPPLPADGFLQITRKNCRGPENQLGTCMFNFQCQQQHGEVVGACLDGFLFGACCHHSDDNAIIDHSSSLSISGEHGTNGALVTAMPLSAELVETINNYHKNMSSVRPMVEISPWGSPPASNDVKGPTDAIDIIQHNIPPHLPLEWMFLSNKSLEEPGGSTEHQFHDKAIIESQLALPGNWPLDGTKSAIGESSSHLVDEHHSTLINQISHVESTAIPVAATPMAVLNNQDDPGLQAQLAVLLQAHSEEPVSVATNAEESTVSSTTIQLSPSRKPPAHKRTRPKPSTTPMSTTPSSLVTSEAESLSEQQANVLQFLVSNPPAWVLDEIINGSTMTTWYPLPIPDSLPGSFLDQQHSVAETLATPTPLATSTSRPLKRKPTKTRPPSRSDPTDTTTTTTTEMSTVVEEVEMTTTTTTTTTTRRPRPVFDYTKNCGVRPMVPEARIVGGRRSDYGRWPWQVLIRESTWFGIFSKNKCGGVLISDRHVLTAAHCQPGFLGSLLVVLGEFDLTGHSEPNTPVEKNVKRVVVHRDYVERTFENDLAILELETPVEFKPYIVPICLPSTSDGDFVGQKAEVTGWGKLSHNGPTPGVLYEVDVPIMSNPECHDMFKKAGHEKRILDSFVCAGYTEGKKDSCEGDSGGPLMVEREDGRWSLVGTVSHGIRCAYPNMPGVYMRMTYYRPWIERVTGIGGTQLG